MPWNPMRVEQRIGRLDRIGQRYETVRIHNFYYDGTVEAKVYKKLRDRINAFQTIVGNLQPILARVPTFIERAVMSADPEEEGVMLSEFETVLETPPLRPALDEMVEIDVESDLKEISKPLPLSPIIPENIQDLFINSQIFKQLGIEFHPVSEGIFQLRYQSQSYLVTFSPQRYEENPSLYFLTFGNPLFKNLLDQIVRYMTSRVELG
jgi:hypothetical protein